MSLRHHSEDSREHICSQEPSTIRDLLQRGSRAAAAEGGTTGTLIPLKLCMV